MFRVLFYSLVLLFLILMQGCPSESICKTNADCLETPGSICCLETGSCVASSACSTSTQSCSTAKCIGDLDCKNNQECVEECCQEKLKGKACLKDSECENGEECLLSNAGRTCQVCIDKCTILSDCSGRDKCENGCCRLPSCETDGDCEPEGATPYCNNEIAKCAVCSKTEHCKEIGDRYTCQQGECLLVECTTDLHCTTSNKPICDLASNLCTSQIVCQEDKDCKDSSGGRTICDSNANAGSGQCNKSSCIECSEDTECGKEDDLCVTAEEGLKDGARCLSACSSDRDCPKNYDCKEIRTEKKVCFPDLNYCIDPCLSIRCEANERCEEGKCIKIPEPCDPCEKDEDCGPGNRCINSANKKVCGMACQQDSDCPQEMPGKDFACLFNQCTDKNGCNDE